MTEQAAPHKPTMIPNHVLADLPSGEYERLRPLLHQVDLEFNANIYTENEKINYVYFPNEGILSIVATVDETSSLEVGIVGCEGMVGMPIFLGVNTSRNNVVVQGQGTAMRMKARDFARESKAGALHDLMLRHAYAMLVQVSQSALCYRFHSIEKRFARWLLMTSDRMESNDFLITQEFLSNMLGVRREAVSRAAGSMQKKGMIGYKRGKILIIDRPALEGASCDCYKIIRGEER